MPSLDFPTNPTDQQTYTLNGITYQYNAAIGAWLTVVVGSQPVTLAANTQVLYSNNGLISGSNGLVFNNSANTLYANTIVANSINVISDMRVTGNLRVGTGTVTITNNSIEAASIIVAGSAIPSGNSANLSYATANAGFVTANAGFAKANAALANASGTFAGSLSVTGNVGIGVSGATTESALHVKVGTAISAMGVNAQTAVLIEGSNSGFLQFRQTADNGRYNGVIFTDNNMGGYIVHGNGGNVDALRLGGYNAIYFDVGSEDSTNGINVKTNRGYFNSNGLYVVGTLITSSVSQKYAISSATAVTIATATPTTIASCTITTTGKPVLIVGSGDCNPANGGDWNYIAIYRDSTQVGKIIINQTSGASYNNPFGITHIDTPGAGTYTYSLKANQGAGTITYGETGNHQAPTICVVELI